MLAYLVVVIFPLFVEGWYKKKVGGYKSLKDNETRNKKIRWRYLFFAALPMFFLIAFRNQSIGADTNGYLENFERTINIPWDKLADSSRMEYVYLVFVKLVTYITHSPLGFQIIYTTIYLLALICFTNELEKEHFLFLFLFGTLGLYTFMFTGVRQCLAISFCMFSVKFIKKRKILPFALLMLLSFQFHKSSILFVVAYFIYSRKLNWINLLIYTVVMIFSVLYLSELQQWFNEQLDYDYGVEGQTGGIIFSMVMIMITTFTIFVVSSNKSLTKPIQGLINVGIIATILWVVRIFTRIAERPSFYFMACSFAAFAYAISTIKDKKEKDIIRVIVVTLSLALFVYRFFTSHQSFIPYAFYLA